MKLLSYSICATMLLFAAALGFVIAFPAVTSAQEETPPLREQLAPGVLQVIPPDPKTEETFAGPISLIEVVKGIPNLEWTPNYSPKTETLLEMAKSVTLRHPVWNLEFAFKPLRMIEVDVPQPNGKLARKRIWYMVYRVRYLGAELKPTAQEDNFGHRLFPTSDPVDEPSRRFIPLFVLQSHEYDKEYVDRVIPAAAAPIAQREQVGTIHNTVKITQIPVELSTEGESKEVWGYATWENVDPRIDHFSIYVGGLTNAYKFEETGQFEPGDPVASSRDFEQKVLKLNIWRPGDAVREHEGEIRFGIPIDAARQEELNAVYNQEQRLDYIWVYR